MTDLVVSPTVLLSPVEEGYVAYDREQDRLHRLNPLAALIVELCNGRRNVTEIIELVTPLLPVDHAVSEVEQWIDSAIESGLLAHATDSTPPPATLSVPDLTQLAARLQEQGKTTAALICQRQAVELDPQQADNLALLGEYCHIVGQREQARDAYERYLQLRPQDEEVRHLLVPLRDETPPPRVPDSCVAQLYARFAEFYETNVYEELASEAPQQLTQLIEGLLHGRQSLSVLELGCGTGIAGQLIRPKAARLVGVDLSAEMVELARQRKLYDQLEVAEITAWLETCEEKFDLILACDSLIYFGDLRQVFAPAARLLRPGGLLACTLEAANRPGFYLTDSGRYAHHPTHVRQAAAASRLAAPAIKQSFLRMEYGEEVAGLYVGMSAKPASRTSSTTACSAETA